jgi:hypothetical protein
MNIARKQIKALDKLMRRPGLPQDLWQQAAEKQATLMQAVEALKGRLKEMQR